MYRLDLHIHTPASRCFADTRADDMPRQIVSRAIASGLDMIAITDHHSVEYVDKMRQAARKRQLVLLPGVELSTRVGKTDDVYLLAIFEEQKPKAELDKLLVDLGIKEQHWGDCHFRIDMEFEDIIAKVKHEGGLLISNHLDKTPQRRAFFPQIINQYQIKAFDLKDISYKDYLEKEYPQAIPLHFFTFSDAHRLTDIGHKYSEVNLSACSFSGIQKL